MAATVQGVYDFWLGGSQHTRADRELGRAVAERFPTVPAHLRAAERFHQRAACWAAERGISRFIRAGAVPCLPAGENLHEAVRRVRPGAGTVYVSRSAGWIRVRFAGEAEAAGADAGRPGEVLEAGPVAALLAGREPACLVLGMVSQFEPPGLAAANVAAYAAALPPGSVLAVSAGLLRDSPEGDELAAMFTPARVYRHTARDVAGWLEGAGLRLVPPGVRDVREVPGGQGLRPAAGREPGPGVPAAAAGVLGTVPRS